MNGVAFYSKRYTPTGKSSSKIPESTRQKMIHCKISNISHRHNPSAGKVCGPSGKALRDDPVSNGPPEEGQVADQTCHTAINPPSGAQGKDTDPAFLPSCIASTPPTDHPSVSGMSRCVGSQERGSHLPS